MGSITINDISTGLILLVGLITGITYLIKSLKDSILKLLKDEFKGLNSRIDALDEKLDVVDRETCKNFLVRFLADVDNGAHITEVEKQRFWEEYEHYLKTGGNSYIRDWVEKLKSKGFL